jgi:FtsP/CotA-like multicopper oxidase with cupredoxin domain
MITRRGFLTKASAAAAAAALGTRLQAQTPADVTLDIAPLNLEIAPGKVIPTIAYNGSVPGPLIRWPEGKPIAIQVTNRTASGETVHWHGMRIPSVQDGAMEEGSPMIPPGGSLRYEFTPQPAGFRWYHTHVYAGHNLKAGSYTGQFGSFFVEPRQSPGAFDREVFLALHDWKGYMGGGGDASMDVVYDHATVNGRMLGAGNPIRVRSGDRVLFRILNASATLAHSLALPGHTFQVLAMDGNSVPDPASVPVLRLAPAERLDVLVTMDQPGVWVLGEISDDHRKAGMGIVIEYAQSAGPAKWLRPAPFEWDYRLFAAGSPVAQQPDQVVPLLFESRFRGHGEFDYWTINGKSYPNTEVVPLEQGRRYRLAMTNKSSDDHPIHLHRHTFEVAAIDGKPISGLLKDVLVVRGKGSAEVDFTANNPGPTLFHCHQQSHMDFGFMMLLKYTSA